MLDTICEAAYLTDMRKAPGASSDTKTAGTKKTPLQEAVAEFEVAEAVLEAASKKLNPLVSAEMKNRTSVEELMDLTYQIPASYHGTRRIYERILRIRDEEPKIAGRSPSGAAKSSGGRSR